MSIFVFLSVGSTLFISLYLPWRSNPSTTGGIGQKSNIKRGEICKNLQFLGAKLDDQLNNSAKVSQKKQVMYFLISTVAFSFGNSMVLQVAEISTKDSSCKLLVVATDEAHAVAKHTAELILKNSNSRDRQ